MSSRVYVPHTKVRDIPAGPVLNRDDLRGSQNFMSEMQGDMTDIVDQHETILTWTPAGMVAVD